MTPEALVARAMLSAVKCKGGIAQSDISYYAIPGGNNRTYETALYNLTVLNRLGMCCFRNRSD